MKKAYTIAGALMLSGIILTGCTNGNNNSSETEKSSSASQTEAAAPKDTKAVSEAVNSYYTDLTSKSDEFTKASDQVKDIITKSTSAETYDSFAASDNPFEEFNKLDDDQAKTLADNLQKVNPIADQFDYSGMSDKDRALLNLLNIASGVIYSGSDEKSSEIEMTVPDDAVKFDKTTATVNYSDVKFTYNKEEQNMSTDAFGSKDITLNYVDGKWKISGEKSIQSLKELQKRSQGSDGGEG